MVAMLAPSIRYAPNFPARSTIRGVDMPITSFMARLPPSGFGVILDLVVDTLCLGGKWRRPVESWIRISIRFNHGFCVTEQNRLAYTSWAISRFISELEGNVVDSAAGSGR
jgi:hypothetical protein